ncbi:MAG: hypothetical protein WBC44_05310 [Planctomycetaceae bacterium]
MPHAESMPHAGDANPTPVSPAPAATSPDAPVISGGAPRSTEADLNLAAGNPNAPPAEEVVAATFPTSDASEHAISDLLAAGVQRDYVVLLTDRDEKRNFLKQYVHRDGDRHTHGGVAAVFSGLLGAIAMGMIALATISQYMPEGFGPPAAAVVGGIVGGTLGAVLGGLAFRTADDSSMEIVDTIASDGLLVAVRRPLGSSHVSLDEVGRILQRHNGRAVRLRHQVSQADRHPGDMRPDQMWVNDRPGVPAPPK